MPSGQIEIVVDRLRHVDDLEMAGRVFSQFHRREGGVVAADRDQPIDARGASA